MNNILIIDYFPIHFSLSQLYFPTEIYVHVIYFTSQPIYIFSKTVYKNFKYPVFPNHF